MTWCASLVTRQAVGVRIACVVTFYAPPHVERGDAFNSVHLFHWPVALLASKACRHVALMGEVDVVGNPIDSVPNDWLTFVKRFVDHLNVRLVLVHKFVTAMTTCARRDTGDRASRSVTMTGSTADLIHACVDFVTEGNGLRRRRGCRMATGEDHSSQPGHEGSAHARHPRLPLQ